METTVTDFDACQMLVRVFLGRDDDDHVAWNLYNVGHLRDRNVKPSRHLYHTEGHSHDHQR